MDLVRDLLDLRVVDRNGRDMGRVDGIVLDAPSGQPPRVVAIAIGPSVLGHRLGPIVGRWAEAVEHALGVDAGRPLRVPVELVLGITDQVTVDLAFGETSAAAVEQRLARCVRRIPGGS